MSQQRDLLEPFSAAAIKTVDKGKYSASFVSWTDKIQRLQQLGLEWNFTIQGFSESGDQHEPVACHGRLAIRIDETARVFDGIGQGQDAKKASTDAFARACAFAGLGLHLWCQGGSKDSGYWVTGKLR